MYQLTEPFISWSKANIETSLGVASIALDAGGRALKANVRALKIAQADGAQRVKSLLASNKTDSGTRETAGAATLGLLSIEAATDYVKSMCDIAAESQGKLGRLFEEQIAGLSAHLAADLDQIAKSAPANAEAVTAAVKSTLSIVDLARDSVSKSVACLAEAAQAGSEAAVAKEQVGRKKAA